MLYESVSDPPKKTVSPPGPPVDKPILSGYTLNQIVDALAPRLLNLENREYDSHNNAESDAKGASAMAKTFKQRVKIGVDESKTPIYKWAVGHSIDEMNDAIVRIYVEHGLIDKFLHTDRASIPSKKEIPKFKPYALKWFDTYKRTTLKPTTLQGYTSNMTKHLFPAFGNMRLDEITTDSVQQFLNNCAHLAQNTVHTMFVLFSEIMDSAFEDHYIQFNPAKSRRLSIPSKKKKTRNALSPDQLKKIISQIPEKLTDDTERRTMALMVFTGMRRGEVLGLRWEDIDFEKKLITVSRAVSYTTNQPIVSEPKTQSGKRTIPLNDQLVEFLKPLQDSGYVVGGEAPPTQMVYRRIERHIFQKVDTFGATPHVFRHSYISAMAEAGIDLKTLQYISGHSNVTTTMGIYAHTRLGLVQEAGDKVGELLRQ